MDFTGLRVGVVGTGSSAIQSIPVIAAEAKHLTVFQRTPNYSIPARNHDLTPEYQTDWKNNYLERRRQAREETRNGVYGKLPVKGALEDTPQDRRKAFDDEWKQGGLHFLATYNDLALNKASNDTAAEYVREKIGLVVKDPKVAELLQPTTYPIGTKRICLDIDYFETFNRDNVTLVDVREAPIEEMTPKGLKTGGKEYEFDAIVFATGFDAMTGSFAKVDIRGRSGLTLKQKWAAGPIMFFTVMPSGQQEMAAQFIGWFVYSLFIGMVAAYVTGLAYGPGTGYMHIFRMATTVAFIGYVGSLPQFSIWYKRSWRTTLVGMADGLIYGMLTAGALGWLWPR